MFQMSGQGPYFGQCAWFTVLHHEKLPSAISRYQKEVSRILGVLNSCLEGKEWLVGDKCTFADLAFVSWNSLVDILLGTQQGTALKDFPNVEAWHERMVERESWKKCMRIREKLMVEEGLGWNGMPEGVSNMKEYEEKMKRDGDL